MSQQSESLGAFLDDLVHLFDDRRVTYVDVGAYTGEVFERLVQSDLEVREAHLFEPNPDSFSKLRQRVEALGLDQPVDLYNLALGDSAGSAVLHKSETMSRVIEPTELDRQQVIDQDAVEVPRRTLDDVSSRFTDRRISLLKLDVEGSELGVLEGAKDLLSRELIDVVYVEAGLNPAGTQQCYYRDVEDRLNAHGYRVFRVYEQQHEWPQDSPLLRRMNLAFLSRSFALTHPKRLSELRAELSVRRREIDRLKKELEERATAVDRAREEIARWKEGEHQRREEEQRRLASQNVRWAEERRDLERYIWALEKDRDKLLADSEKVRQRYIELKSSRSWRLTAPYRRLGQALRYLTRGSSSSSAELPPPPRLKSTDLPRRRPTGAASAKSVADEEA